MAENLKTNLPHGFVLSELTQTDRAGRCIRPRLAPCPDPRPGQASPVVGGLERRAGREPWPIPGRTCPCLSQSHPHPLVKIRQWCKGHLVLMCLIKSFTFLRCSDGFTVLTRQDPLPPHPAPFTGHRVLSEDAPSHRGHIYRGPPLPLPAPSHRPRHWDHDLCPSMRRRHSVSAENVPARPAVHRESSN